MTEAKWSVVGCIGFVVVMRSWSFTGCLERTGLKQWRTQESRSSALFFMPALNMLMVVSCLLSLLWNSYFLSLKIVLIHWEFHIIYISIVFTSLLPPTCTVYFFFKKLIESICAFHIPVYGAIHWRVFNLPGTTLHLLQKLFLVCNFSTMVGTC